MAAARRALASSWTWRHGRLEDRELDGPAGLDEEGLAGVELADLVGVDPGPVGHVDAGLAGRPPGIQLPGLLGVRTVPAS